MCVGSGEVQYHLPLSWLPLSSRAKCQLGKSSDKKCKWPEVTSRLVTVEARGYLSLLNFHCASGLILNLLLRIAQSKNLVIC